MDGQCLKNYLWMVLNEKKMSKFNENFIKNYDEFSKKGYFLEVDIEYPKDLHELPGDLPFLPERMKVINAISLYAICMIKLIMLST